MLNLFTENYTYNLTDRTVNPITNYERIGTDGPCFVQRPIGSRCRPEHVAVLGLDRNSPWVRALRSNMAALVNSIDTNCIPMRS